VETSCEPRAHLDAEPAETYGKDTGKLERETFAARLRELRKRTPHFSEPLTQRSSSGINPDTDYAAVQTLGYDIDRKAHTGLWIDNFMSYQWPLEGSMEADGKELVITASGPGPDGGTFTFRERYQFQSVDSIAIVAEMLKEETWVPFMTTQLTRKENTPKTDQGISD
jgi:hypothetical protein